MGTRRRLALRPTQGDGVLSDFFTPFDQDTATGMRGIARELGFRYADTTKDRGYKDEAGGIPGHLPLFSDADFDTTVTDLCYGTFAGYPVQVFNYDTIVYRDDPEETTRTCVMFEIPAVLPALTVAPHSRLSLANQRNIVKSSFSARFQTISRDPEFKDAILTEGMQKWLTGTPDGMRLEMSRSSVLAHVGRVEPDEVPGLITMLFTFVIQIPEPVMKRWGTGH